MAVQVARAVLEQIAGPLKGICVIECSTVAPGPWAAQILGDLGAYVIKIELKAGDTTRYLGTARNEKMPTFYLACNRNKRSIVSDLKSDTGRDASYALVKKLMSSFTISARHRPRDWG